MVKNCMNLSCFHTENKIKFLVNFSEAVSPCKPAFCIVYLDLGKLKMVIYGTIYSTIKTDVMRPPRIHDCTQDSISKILKFIQTFFIESKSSKLILYPSAHIHFWLLSFPVLLKISPIKVNYRMLNIRFSAGQNPAIILDFKN